MFFLEFGFFVDLPASGGLAQLDVFDMLISYVPMALSDNYALAHTSLCTITNLMYRKRANKEMPWREMNAEVRLPGKFWKYVSRQ